MDNDMLSSLLNNPDALQNAMKTISDMLRDPQQSDASTNNDYDPSAELMERALPMITSILQSGQGAVNQEKRALLNAVKPFVSNEVAAQFDHAMRLVSMARIARTIISELHPQDANDADYNMQ